MKRTLLLIAAIGLVGPLSLSVALAADNDSPGNHNSWTNGVPPGTGPGVSNYYNWNYSWSNYFNYGYSNNYAWGTNQWWKHGEDQSDKPAPKKWQKQNQEIVGPQGRPDDRPKRAGHGERPADVQAMIQQFQQNRQTLMQQLKNCSDQQRQEVLQEMERLRTQLREQVATMARQARQDAMQQQTRMKQNLGLQLQSGSEGNGVGNRNRGQ